MFNPALYQKYIAFQKRDALNTLQKFSSKIKWRNNASIIDLGSGDGFVTSNILKKHLPIDFNRLVGVDISKEMVEFANKKYGDEKTKFTLMDISGKVPKAFERSFDFAFSSYAIQFIPNQEKAFSNINCVLNDGGSCLLVFGGRNKLYDVFAAMAQTEKWHTWMKNDINNLIVRYHKIEDGAGEVKRIMKETGFKNIYVEDNKTTFDFETLDHLLKMIESANLFHLPPEVHREFIEDFGKVVVDLKSLERVEGKPEAARLRYHKLIAYGTK